MQHADLDDVCFGSGSSGGGGGGGGGSSNQAEAMQQYIVLISCSSPPRVAVGVPVGHSAPLLERRRQLKLAIKTLACNLHSKMWGLGFGVWSLARLGFEVKY